MWLVGVVIRRYIDILIIIINFPYSTCIRSFFGSSILTSLFIFKCFFGLVYIYIRRILHSSTISVGFAQARPSYKLFEALKRIRIIYTVLMQNRSCFTRQQTCNGEYTKYCTRSRHQLNMAAPAEVSEKTLTFE